MLRRKCWDSGSRCKWRHRNGWMRHVREWGCRWEGNHGELRHAMSHHGSGRRQCKCGCHWGCHSPHFVLLFPTLLSLLWGLSCLSPRSLYAFHPLLLSLLRPLFLIPYCPWRTIVSFSYCFTCLVYFPIVSIVLSVSIVSCSYCSLWFTALDGLAT